MKTQKKPNRLIILIPHRDSLKAFADYRQKLFFSGFLGAYSFPLCAPLAEVSRPFSQDELKKLARNLREMRENGKIHSTKAAIVDWPGKFSFFGPLLDIPADESVFPRETREKVLNCFLPPVLNVALLEGEITQNSIDAPALSFRAAFLANLFVRPLDETGLSFEWRMSEPVWLPAQLRDGRSEKPTL